MTGDWVRARFTTAGWALAGVVWTAGWARSGPGMTADTMDYVGIGRAPFQLHPDVFQWPPLLWGMLQTARAVGLPAWTAAIVVMCIGRALVASGAFRLGHALAGPGAGHGLALFSFVWVPLTYAGLYGLSDTFFLGVMLWWLASAHGMRVTSPNLSRQVWVTTGWAVVMVATRFVGLAFAIVEVCVAFLMLRAAGRRTWLRSAGGMVAALTLPVLAWAFLGAAQFGEAVGMRAPTRHALGVHLANIGTGWWEPVVRGRYGDVFWGDQGGFGAPALRGQSLLYIGCILLAWVTLLPRNGGAPWWRVRLAAMFALVLILLLGSSMAYWLDPIGPRLLLPLVFLAAAAVAFPLERLQFSRWSWAALAIWAAAWGVDCLVGGGLTPRFGAPLLAGLGYGGGALALVAARLDPEGRWDLRRARPAMAVLLCVLIAPQVLWTGRLLHRVADGGMPSVQHPGWRRHADVRALLGRVEPGDTIYTHTPEVMRALLNDRRDIAVEPLCFRRLSFDCEPSLEEYVAALDHRPRERAEWIVLLERVSVPYLFRDELSALAAARPDVTALESPVLAAYRWPPD